MSESRNIAPTEAEIRLAKRVQGEAADMLEGFRGIEHIGIADVTEELNEAGELGVILILWVPVRK